jgi:hypothetical protein
LRFDARHAFEVTTELVAAIGVAGALGVPGALGVAGALAVTEAATAGDSRDADVVSASLDRH